MKDYKRFYCTHFKVLLFRLCDDVFAFLCRNSSLARALQPSVLMQMKLSDGRFQRFEVFKQVTCSRLYTQYILTHSPLLILILFTFNDDTSTTV